MQRVRHCFWVGLFVSILAVPTFGSTHTYSVPCGTFSGGGAAPVDTNTDGAFSGGCGILVPKFNSSLGTLTNVHIEVDVTSFTFTWGGQAPGAWDSWYSFINFQMGIFPVPFSTVEDVGFGGGPGREYLATGGPFQDGDVWEDGQTGSGSTTMDFDLGADSNYVGSGNASLTVAVGGYWNIDAIPDVFEGGIGADFAGSVTVTYTYTTP